MKKTILFGGLIAVLFLLAACGDTTGNSVKDTDTIPRDDSQVSTCGDGECTEDEMCDVDTLKVGCIDDCGPCPTSLYAKGFDCATSNCVETSDNHFDITGEASVELEVVNLGGVLANTLEIDHVKCYSGNTRVLASYGKANYKGYIFYNEGFNGDNEVRLASHGSKRDRATYTLTFQEDDSTPKETPFELRCVPEIKTHSPMIGKEQTIYLSFK